MTLSISKLGSKPKKLILSLMIVSMAPGLQACTDEEVATGVAIVAIGAAGVAIGIAAGSDKDRNRHEPVCRRETRCRSYRDYYGRYRQECREVSNCNGRGRHHNLAFASLSGAESGQAAMTEGFAETFSLSSAASGKLLTALEAARLGNAAELEVLGLNKDELRRLSNYRMPSSSGVEALSRSLNADAAAVKAMLKKLIDIAYEQSRPRHDEFGGH